MGVLDKCAKRRKYPVDIDGEKIHVRALTYDEIDRLQLIGKDLKTGFILACGLLEDSGESAVPARVDPESDAEWIARVIPVVRSIPSDTILEIVAAIDKVSRPADKLAKN